MSENGKMWGNAQKQQEKCGKESQNGRKNVGNRLIFYGILCKIVL